MVRAVTISRGDGPHKVCLLAMGGAGGLAWGGRLWLFLRTPVHIQVRNHVIWLPTNLATLPTYVVLAGMERTAGTSMSLHFF